MSQLFRIPSDPSSTDIERLTHFDIGTGRTISSIARIAGDDWRGPKRNGGSIIVMDLDGSERTQLWYVDVLKSGLDLFIACFCVNRRRVWEDSLSAERFPKIEGELENSPGPRIERLTHDNYRYSSLGVSDSDR